MGTIGLLFDSLYTRRSLTMQGPMLASMGLTALILLAYTAWYLLRPDAKPNQQFGKRLTHTTIVPVLALGVLWVLHIVAIQPTFRIAFVAYIGTLKRFSILISVILGFLFFKEEDFKKRFWAALFIVVGALLIATDDLPTKLATKISGLGF